jgi:hypothetical protein
MICEHHFIFFPFEGCLHQLKNNSALVIIWQLFNTTLGDKRNTLKTHTRIEQERSKRPIH